MDNCTIYSPGYESQRVEKIVKEFFPNDEVVVKGNTLEWDSVEVKAGASRLLLNSKVRKVPGDDFSRLIMSTHTYLSGIPERDGKDRVLKIVLGTKWTIGVVSDPGFENNPSHEECVFKICQEIGGMVFNGQRMLSGSGDELLIP